MASRYQSERVQNAETILSGKLGRCYIRVDGKVYDFASVSKLEAKVERTKSEFNIIGYTGKIHKSTGWKGTGTAAFRFNTSFFNRIMYRFQADSNDFLFDIVVENRDPQTTAKIGYSKTRLLRCSIDSGTLAKIGADDDLLEHDISFTFDEFQLGEAFRQLPSGGGSYSPIDHNIVPLN